MRGFMVLSFIFLTCGFVFADDCNTNIKQTDTYQELNVILNCLSNKIQNIENEMAKIQNIEKSTPNNSKMDSLVFDNEYLSIYGIKALKDNDSIYISFTIKSLSNHDIQVCIGRRDKITISDDTGKINTLPNNSAYNTGIDGSCETTLISPGQLIKAGLKFEKLTGDTITLSIPFSCVYDIDNNKYVSFTISAENIKISGS